MKTIIIIKLMLFISIISIKSSAQVPSKFSGIWNRNEKSDGGGLSINSITLKLEVTQENEVIVIKGTNRTGNGDMTTYSDILNLDGSQTERKAGTNQKKQITVKWSADKKELTETSVYKDEQGNVTQSIKAIFSLSSDGKILTINDERTFDGQTYKLTDVYDKQ